MEFLEFFINRNSLVKNSDTITSLKKKKKKNLSCNYWCNSYNQIEILVNNQEDSENSKLQD